MADRLGNVRAIEGCTRCECGCKYWEYDRCVDCGAEAPREIIYQVLDPIPAFTAF